MRKLYMHAKKKGKILINKISLGKREKTTKRF